MKSKYLLFLIITMLLYLTLFPFQSDDRVHAQGMSSSTMVKNVQQSDQSAWLKKYLAEGRADTVDVKIGDPIAQVTAKYGDPLNQKIGETLVLYIYKDLAFLPRRTKKPLLRSSFSMILKSLASRKI